MPYIRPFYKSESSCISYFVCCPGSGVAAVIDPSEETEQYVAAAGSEQCRITHVIDTHVHSDHVSGARKLVDRLGGRCDLTMAKGADVSFDFVPIDEGQTVEVGDATLKAIRTPGHTTESMSLLYSDRKRAEEPWGVFTGDAMFVGDVGRLDLIGHGTLRQAYESLDRLRSLPDYVEIYPAHYAGSDCASNRNLSFKTSSTVGFEKRHNQMLRWQSFEEFEGLLVKEPLKSPPMWREIKLFNQGRLAQIAALGRR